MDDTTKRTAFAISGLAGNNAYGAGFLAAAQEATRRRGLQSGLYPGLEMITATSGAIASTATYLLGGDLRAQTQAGIDGVDRATLLPDKAWADPLRQSLITGWTGLPGIFGSYAQALTEHLVADAATAMTTGRPVIATPKSVVDTLLPARMFVPEIPQSQFVSWAETFNGAGIGVAFNSYDPSAGQEYLYVNQIGLERIRDHHDCEARYGGQRRRSTYQPITPEALREALWLFWYGFPHPDQHVDGAYARSIILNEVTFADRIYAVKPINDRWIGPLPTTAFEVLDMQTELWMGTSYRLQRHQIDLINRLIEDGRLGPADPSLPATRRKHYHRVEIVPVEIETQRGFFTYFVESMSVFDAAYHETLRLLGP